MEPPDVTVAPESVGGTGEATDHSHKIYQRGYQLPLYCYYGMGCVQVPTITIRVIATKNHNESPILRQPLDVNSISEIGDDVSVTFRLMLSIK